jgi:hypothetical protein
MDWERMEWEGWDLRVGWTEKREERRGVKW